MSEKNNKNKNKMEQTEQKIVTKYDRKMERRKLEKEREEKSRKRTFTFGIIILVAVVAFILSFPIRNYLALHRAYIKVNGEKVTQVEYDYYFGMNVSSYYNQFGAYLSVFGIDLSGDLSKQMYSDTLTMKDYFDMNTVATLKQNKALLAQAKADGYTFDTTEEYEEFVSTLEETAAASGETVRDYVKNMAGDYATLGRISKYIKETIYITHYTAEKEKEFAPSDEEVEKYYQENKDSYDSFNYRMTTISASLPTEPTDLADSEPAYDTDGSYIPSDAEVAKAMEEAKSRAEAEQKTMAKSGEEHTGESYSSLNSYIEDWMLDESRKAQDTTIIENTAANCYYVVAFEERYLNTDPTVDARIIYATAADGENILAEWKNGDATEESFIALCNSKSLNTALEDGLYEGITKNSMNSSITDWLYDSARQSGDTTVLTENDYSYVVYYIGKNDPSYQLSIRDTLTVMGMNEFVTSLTENITVEDPRGNLNYLAVQAAESGTEETSSEAQ